MERVSTEHYSVHSIKREQKMERFGKRIVSTFRAELGYGYVEVKQNQLPLPQRLHKRVMLMNEVNKYSTVALLSKRFYLY